MTDKEKLKKLVETLAPSLARARGLELWGLEASGPPGLRICVYVEAPEGAPESLSAGIDQCEEISRQLGLALDVEDPVQCPYTLEVSSPGADRKFFRPEQMRPYAGQLLDVRLREAGEDGRKVWRGRLLELAGDAFRLQPCSVSPEGDVLPEGEPLLISWANAALVRLFPVFAAPRKPGKGGGRKKAR